MSRSTSSDGRVLIFSPNLHDTVHAPFCVLRAIGCIAGHEDLQVLEFISDLGTPSREFVIESNGQIGPGLGDGRVLFRWLIHVYRIRWQASLEHYIFRVDSRRENYPARATT